MARDSNAATCLDQRMHYRASQKCHWGDSMQLRADKPCLIISEGTVKKDKGLPLSSLQRLDVIG